MSETDFKFPFQFAASNFNDFFADIAITELWNSPKTESSLWSGEMQPHMSMVGVSHLIKLLVKGFQ